MSNREMYAEGRRIRQKDEMEGEGGTLAGVTGELLDARQQRADDSFVVQDLAEGRHLGCSRHTHLRLVVLQQPHECRHQLRPSKNW